MQLVNLRKLVWWESHKSIIQNYIKLLNTSNINFFFKLDFQVLLLKYSNPPFTKKAIFRNFRVSLLLKMNLTHSLEKKLFWWMPQAGIPGHIMLLSQVFLRRLPCSLILGFLRLHMRYTVEIETLWAAQEWNLGFYVSLAHNKLNIFTRYNGKFPIKISSWYANLPHQWGSISSRMQCSSPIKS